MSTVSTVCLSLAGANWKSAICGKMGKNNKQIENCVAGHKTHDDTHLLFPISIVN